MSTRTETLLIKPHHFLDIIKLFGSGLERFVPNIEYGHDFWKVGNEILENPNVQLELTINNDAICTPCKFRRGSACSDVTSANTTDISKDEWNKRIDRRLLKLLGLEDGAKLSARELCRLARQKITREGVFEVWKEKPVDVTAKRAGFLMAGFEKYSQQ
jgi:hypothetical protein